MTKKILIALLLLIAIGFSDLTVIQPVHKALNNNLYLGKIAPGQQLKLVFSREIGPEGNAKAIFWEKVLIPKQILLNESLEGDTITAWIKIPLSMRGNYTFNATAQGDLLYIKPETHQITIDVTENTYTLSCPENFESKASQPITIPIEIKSNSIADDEIKLVGAENFPLKWIQFPETKIKAGETKKILVKFNPTEEGDYKITLKIGRRSSNLINLIRIHLKTRPTIKSKLLSFQEGFSITPIIMQPFYSFLSLIGYY